MKTEIWDKIPYHFYKLISVFFVALLFVLGSFYFTDAYTWGSIQTVDAGVGDMMYMNHRGGVLFDNSLAVMVTYHDAIEHVQYFKYAPNPASVSWTTVALEDYAGGSGYGYNSSIQMNPNDGSILVVYNIQHADAITYLKYAKCNANFDGSNCTDISDWTIGTLDDSNPAITYFQDLEYDDFNDRWGILYFGGTSLTELYYKTSVTGTESLDSWTTQRTLTYDLGNWPDGYHRNLAFGPSGQAAIGAFRASGGNTCPLVHHYNGSSWTQKSDFENCAAQNTPGTSVGYDSSGNLLVAYMRKVDGTPYWDSWKYSASTWTDLGTIEESVDNEVNNGEGGSLVRMASGHLSYVYYTNSFTSFVYTIRHVEWDGSNWGTPETIKASGGQKYKNPFHDMSYNDGFGVAFFDDQASDILNFVYSAPLNVAPTLTDFYPAQNVGFNTVTVTTTIADADGDITSSTFQYSLNGTDWSNATISSVTQVEAGDGVVTSAGSLTDIDTDTDTDNSVNLTIVWNAGIDAPNTNTTTAYIRMIPYDSTTNGTTYTSAAFTLDTLDPTAPGALTMNTTSTNSVILNFGSASSDTHFSEYKIFYKIGSSSVTESDTAFTSSSDINLSAENFNAALTTSISSLASNTQYVNNIWAYDTFGNSASSTSELAFYTLAPTPTNVATTSLATSSAAFDVDTFNNHNSASSSYYFRVIKTVDLSEAGNSGWQAGDNTWSISGLSELTGYEVFARYRNGDGIETAEESLVFTTLESAPLVPAITSATSTASNIIHIILDPNGNASTTTYLVHDSVDNVYLQAGMTWSVGEAWLSYEQLGELSGISTTGLSPNTQHTIEAKAKNVSEEQTAYGSSQGVYTLANIPLAPTLTASSTSIIHLAIGTNSNPDATEYVLCQTGDGATCASNGYVQADGTLGASEIWRSYTLWGGASGIDISGLVANTQYQFLVKARNGDNTETSLGTGASAYTFASAPTSVSASVEGSNVIVSWSGTASAYYVEDSANAGTNSGWITATSYTFSSLSNGSYTFHVKGKNAADVDTSFVSASSVVVNVGNPSTPPPPPPPPPPLCVDDTCDTCDDPPCDPPPSGLMNIDNNAAYALSRFVTLYFNTQFVNQYAVSVDPTFAGESFHPIVPSLPFTLPDGYGKKTVYARFINQYGTYDTYDDIELAKASCQNYPPDFVSVTDIDGDNVPLDGKGNLHVTYNVSTLDVYFDYHDCPYDYDSYRLYISDKPFSDTNEGILWSSWSLFGQHVFEDKRLNFRTNFFYNTVNLKLGKLPETLYMRMLFTLKGELTYGDPISVHVVPMSNQEFCNYFPGEQYISDKMYLLDYPFPFIPAFTYSKICVGDEDTDHDGIINKYDNCPTTHNPDQKDNDGDGMGDVCDLDEKDTDQDGIPDSQDNCFATYNPNQSDVDGDGMGDVCDECMHDPQNDFDGDRTCGDKDNCPLVSNFDQQDSDTDSVGDACDVCPGDVLNDIDKDGICGLIDICPYDLDNDQDKDSICGDVDNCVSTYNPDQADVNGNGVGDVCDKPPAVCGNNIVEQGEDCDGFATDNFYCSLSCRLIQIIPDPICGNGIVEQGEVCDDSNIASGDGCSPACSLEQTDHIDTTGDETTRDGQLFSFTDGITHTIARITHNIAESIKTLGRAVIDVVPESVKALARNVVQAVQKVIDNPQVEKINEIFVAPTLVVVGAANVAVGFQLPNIFAFLRYIFGQPIMALRRRKQKKWGVVYDAFTKQPLDLATIRVVDAEKGNVVRSQVTDTQGRYYLIVEPGKYRLEVSKLGFGEFSEYLLHKNEDAKYINLYHGDVFTIDDEHSELNYNIPLDAEKKSADTKQILKDYSSRAWHYAVGVVGIIISFVSFVVSPSPVILSLFFFHLLLFGVAYQFGHNKLPRSWGVIIESISKQKLGKVIVRIFDAQYNKLVNTGVTDHKGRYAVLVGPSTYYATYEKEGFKPKKGEEINLSSIKTDGMGGIVSKDEELERQKT